MGGELLQSLIQRIENNQASQKELDEAIASMSALVDRLADTMNAVNSRLVEASSEKISRPPQPAQEAKPQASEDDFKLRLEKLLEGSLEHIGDKISQKIMDKLQGLRGLSGVARQEKIREIEQYAEAESVDLSAIFRDKIESNIDEIGIEEHQAKGINASLEKLRRMREGGGKTDKKDS